MHAFSGASAMVMRPDAPRVDLYISGRDNQNRSMIGRALLDLEQAKVLKIERDPVLVPGELGAFDENGVSYPSLVRDGQELFMFYTGWMPTVLTPFQNHIGLAKLGKDGRFHRVSKAPVLHRTNEDFLAMGSSYAAIEDGVWHLWYTSFTAWGKGPDEPKHRYEIRHATSPDGLMWTQRDKVACIGAQSRDEHSICRPSVLRLNGRQHMWYCYRGERYRIGYAVLSEDGVSWVRSDHDVGIEPSSEGWDSLEQAYPNVVRHGDWLYMVYCGNGYGKEGLGLARLPLADLI